MATGNHNAQGRMPKPFRGRAHQLLRTLTGLIAMFSFLLGGNRSVCADPPLTEYQVKALFLFNFGKYVDWPSEAFDSGHSPFTIGVLGENTFGNALNKVVENKRVNGREFVIRQVEPEDDLSKCHILFISASEKKHLAETLSKIKTAPVLTVGETEQFTQQGGIINFVKKEGKVRLEIDLNAARQSRLQISSKLLSVADVVRGKP